MKDEVVVESKNAKDQEDEGSSSSSSEWQIVDETPEDKAQDTMSREQLERDEETLGRDRDDAMAEEFDESRKLVSVHRTSALFCCFLQNMLSVAGNVISSRRLHRSPCRV